MKVLHLNRSDVGGAGRAAYRIHNALQSIGINSTMWVNHTAMGDWTVENPLTPVDRFISRITPYISNLCTKALRTENQIIHSPAIFPSQWLKYINNSDYDLVHLHWIGAEMLSIKDIALINKPLVWTLHDMWPICGAEHLSFDMRWRDGYLGCNRPKNESGFDLNRWTWERKCKYWKLPIQIVTPSRWLASCVQESYLMSDWPVTVIPNCLDTDRWQPINRDLARDLLGLPRNVPLVMFGAYGAGANASYHKGFDLLISSFEYLREQIDGMELIVLGQLEPKSPPDFGIPVRYAGFLYDDFSLRTLYSAVDVVVVPSRSESFCQTASEAHACGTPVVAFGIGGLNDIVVHKMTGYLAKPFDPTDLANGIRWVLNNNLGDLPHDRAKELFSNAIVAHNYYECYRKVLC